MKRLIYTLLILSMSLLVACSDDDSPGVVPVNPGVVTPIAPTVNSNKLVWQTLVTDTPVSRRGLAEMNTFLYGICWLDGDYPSMQNVSVFGNRDCMNYTDAIHVAVTYDKVTERFELIVRSYCLNNTCSNSGIYVEYRRSSEHQSGSGQPLYVNFGTTYNNTGNVLYEQQTYQVEMTSSVTAAEYESLDVIPFTIYYGDGNLERVVAEVNLTRLR